MSALWKFTFPYQRKHRRPVYGAQITTQLLTFDTEVSGPEPERTGPSCSPKTKAEGYLSVSWLPEENVCETFAHISPLSRD